MCSHRRGIDGAQCILSRGHVEPHDYDDRSYSTKDDSDPGERFSDEERITANLRLQSVSPIGRTVLGLVAFLPPKWRGPVIIFTLSVVGFLIGNRAPDVLHWLAEKVK